MNPVVYAAVTKKLAIEEPLLWAMNNSASDEAATVFETELKITAETSIDRSDVTRSLDALETSAKIDAS